MNCDLCDQQLTGDEPRKPICSACHLNEIDRLIDVIEAVEWVTSPGGANVCPWCYNMYPDHKTDCPRQEALGL